MRNSVHPIEEAPQRFACKPRRNEDLFLLFGGLSGLLDQAPPGRGMNNIRVLMYGKESERFELFAWADPRAVSSFKRHSDGSPVGSLETTHAVIRLASDAPFLFVSGIANRVGRFNEETAIRSYAQNFVAAHNAGIVVAWMVPQLLRFSDLGG